MEPSPRDLCRKPAPELIDQIAATYTPLPLQNMLELAEAKLAETQLATANSTLSQTARSRTTSSPETRLNVINIAPNREPANLSCANARAATTGGENPPPDH